MESDGLPVPRRYWSAATIWLAMAMSVLDASIANIALPTLARELNTTAAASVWVVNAYQLAIVVSLLPLASLGELVGYRRVYQAGLALFTAASIGCALAPNLETLTVARVIQGLGASGIMSMNGALVRYTYPNAQLGRAVGLNALVIALSSALGPTLASAILAATSWHWLFAINGPVGIIAIAIALWALPHHVPAKRRFDIIAAILNALTFGPLILGADALAMGGNPWLGALGVAVGVISATLMVRRSLSQTHPMFPFDLLRIRAVGLSIGTSLTSFTAQSLAFVSLPFMLQYALGRSAVETGFLMTPWPLGVAVIAPIAGRLSDQPIGKALGAIGMAVMATGLLLLAFVPAQAAVWDIAWRMAVCGMGFGMFQAPNNRAIMGSSPRSRLGSAGGLLATGRLAGQTVGASLAAFLFHIAPGSRHLPLLLAAGFAVVAAVVSAFKMRGPDNASSAPAEPEG
ncbi:MAG: MFS transporter [Caulobacterales bacterium 32-69-10]|nr:MAG: MFS transporter [Caulobacterales bacterium 32-69-10]